MKTLMNTLLTALLCSSALSSAADLTIQVDDVAAASGQLMVALYDSADNFPARPYKVMQAAAQMGSTTIVMKDLPGGDYAYAIYHDANGNGRLDRNPAGMPVEDYAFSNNALGKRAAPDFSAAQFTLPAAGLLTRVSLR